jgi:hypothetical protein
MCGDQAEHSFAFRDGCRVIVLFHEPEATRPVFVDQAAEFALEL